MAAAKSGSVKSDCSSGDEWTDLSKSDYAKVIFSKLLWKRESGDIECTFALTETVNQNPSDYIGLFKVGYENISQCLASKTLDKIETENTKLMHCCFKSEDLPELNGFYQFLYITHDKEVCGASMPFEVKQSKRQIESSSDDVVTERVEDGFLMVRHGLEQKNLELQRTVERHQEEKAILMAKIQELINEKGDIINQLEDIRQKINSEYDFLERENDNLKIELKNFRQDYVNVSQECLSLRKLLDGLQIDLKIAKEEKNDLSTKLELLMIEKDGWKNKYETSAAEKNELDSKLEALNKEKCEIASKLTNVTKEKEALSLKLEERAIKLKTSISMLEEETKVFDEDFKTLKAFAKDAIAYAIENELKGGTQKMNETTPNSACSSVDLSNEKGHKLLIQNENLTRAVKTYVQELEQLKTLLRKEMSKNEDYSRELKRANRYLAFDENYRKYCQWEVTEQEELRAQVQELNDARLMIKALEDSKLLVINELRDLTKQLNKVKEELSVAKCENIALKIICEDKIDLSPSHEGKKDVLKKLHETIEILEEENKRKNEEIEKLKASAREWKNKCDSESSKLNTMNVWIEECEQKCTENTLNMNSLKEKLEKCKEEAADKNEEIKALNFTITDLKEKLNSAASLKKCIILQMKKQIYNIKDNDLENNLEQMITEQFEHLSELKNSTVKHGFAVRDLAKELSELEDDYIAAKKDAEDKTVRLLNAAEVYKSLYLEKEMLSKKLKKASSLIAKLCVKGKQMERKPGSITFNCEQTSSNNSDSDTGERVLSPATVPKQVFIRSDLDESSKKFLIKKAREILLSKPNSVASSSNQNKTKIMADVPKKKICPVHDGNPLLSNYSKSQPEDVRKDVPIKIEIMYPDESQKIICPVHDENPLLSNYSKSQPEGVGKDVPFDIEITYSDVPQKKICPVHDETPLPANYSKSQPEGVRKDVPTETKIMADVPKKKICPVHDENPLLSNNSKSQPEGVGKDVPIETIQCSMCEKSFLASPLSNTPMLKHYEIDHNVDMCPLCGQLFDRSLPKQYLHFHVDAHFNSN